VWVRWYGLLQSTYRMGEKTIPPLSFNEIDSSIVNIDEWEKVRCHETVNERIAALLDIGKLPLIGCIGIDADRKLFSDPIRFQAYRFSQGLMSSDSGQIDRPLFPQAADRDVFTRQLITTVTLGDYQRLYLNMSIPIRNLMKNLRLCRNLASQNSGLEFSIDEKLTDTAEQFKDRFMMRIPGFRYPDADFIGFGESSLEFRLEFFIADLSGDHYERRGDVINDIGLAIKEKFGDRIKMPAPQRDVWLNNATIIEETKVPKVNNV
jgi:hypothetical protein